jgi:hypothetical protein
MTPNAKETHLIIFSANGSAILSQKTTSQVISYTSIIKLNYNIFYFILDDNGRGTLTSNAAQYAISPKNGRRGNKLYHSKLKLLKQFLGSPNLMEEDVIEEMDKQRDMLKEAIFKLDSHQHMLRLLLQVSKNFKKILYF